MENNKLHDYMQERKISLLDLSKMTGIPKSTINSIKSNDLKSVKIGQLLIISNALKLPITYFLDTSAASEVREQPTGYNELMSKYVERTDELNEKLKTENEQLRHKLSEMESEKKGSKCV